MLNGICFLHFCNLFYQKPANFCLLIFIHWFVGEKNLRGAFLLIYWNTNVGKVDFFNDFGKLERLECLGMKISVKKGDAIYGLKKGLPYTDDVLSTCDDVLSTSDDMLSTCDDMLSTCDDMLSTCDDVLSTCDDRKSTAMTCYSFAMM